MLEDITLGQILTGGGTIVALVVLLNKVTKPIKDFTSKIDSMNTKIDAMSTGIKSLKSDNIMIKDTIYQMLDHMANNNNTGGMKRVLDQYNEFNRHN